MQQMQYKLDLSQCTASFTTWEPDHLLVVTFLPGINTIWVTS